LGQVGAQTDAGASNAVVNELRLLRQAVERQSTTTARVQLLVAQLSMQFLRASHARSVVDSLETQLATTERDRDEYETALETQRSLEQDPELPNRPELERQSQLIGQRYAYAQQRASELARRVARARESVDIESARYDEVERLLGELDRQIQALR
jgi:hypothetical protein